MSIPQKDQRYTYADYCTWDDSERWELIEGVPYAMAPAPTQAHQEASMNLGWKLRNFLEGKPCKVFAAPFDVRFSPTDKDDIVVQPDLLVVCDSSKLDGNCCNGAPDLVIEILSPSSAQRDCILKLELYQRFGVREYWIIDPQAKILQTYILKNGQYSVTGYLAAATVPIAVLPDCVIDLKEVFSQ